MELKRVVVTGLGSLTPIGNNVQDYWNALIEGRSGAAGITRFDPSQFKTKFVCEVKGFDALDHFHRKEARKMDRYSQYALVSAEEAVNDAGFDLESLDKDSVGVIYGSGIGGIGTFHEEMTNYIEGERNPRFNPFFIPKMILNMAAGHISIKYGFRGPNFATVSACASATHAMIDAFNYIRLSKAKAIITGGSEAGITEASIGGFNAMKALSERNDDAATASRPFDRDRDGFVLGEGSATIVLEELEHALARNARIYAEVVGGGLSADAHHITAPHPDGLGAINVMKMALADGDLGPSSIDYINVHGTSTPLGDVAELKAIQSIFAEHSYNMNISSTKSMTGHLLGAAGAIEAVASIKTIEKGIIPPTINNFNLDPTIDSRFRLTLNQAEKRDVEAVLSNTFGFGGQNAAIVFRKFVA